MLNWREIPFVRLLLPFLLGILLAIVLPATLFGMYGLLLLLSAALLFLAPSGKTFRFRWVFGWMLNLFLFLLGYQVSIQHNSLFSKTYFAHHLNTQNTFTGTIQNIQQSGDWYRVVLNMQSIRDSNEQLQNCSGDLLTYLSIDSLSKRLTYGDQLVIKSQLQPIRPPANPAAFDFQRYWQFKDIHHQSFVRPNQWRLLARDQGHALLATAFETRKALLAILQKHLPTENEYAVASALILGHKEQLNTTIKNAYSGTGAMHVLAVSGLHVGLIYMGMAFFLGFIRSRHPYWQFFRTTILIAGIWMFALLTGASPSVMRAATMFSFIIVGNAMKHHPSIYNTLAVSAFCLLLINPNLLMDVGFQLSYLAVLGIVYFQAKIYRLWIIDNALGDYLWKMSSVALAAQLTTFPISIYYFHQFPVYFWLSGLVVVPAAFIVLGSGIALFFTATFVPVLNVFPATILYWTVWMMNALVFMIHQIPAAILAGIWISFFALLLLYFSLANIAIAINTKKVNWLRNALALLVVLFALTAFSNIRQEHQKQIVFYKIRNKSLIDFIDGKQNIALCNELHDKKTLAFTAQNYRWSQGIQQNEAVDFDTKKMNRENWFYQNGFVQFYDKKLAIIHQDLNIQKHSPIKVNYLLLCNNTSTTVKKLMEHFQFEKIIFDASSKTKRIEKWKKECIKNQIDYYDINEAGALIVPL